MTAGPPTLAQDWTALDAWLRARGHRLDAGATQQFRGGLANLNYLVRIDGMPRVLRCAPRGAFEAGTNDLAREWRVLSALADFFPLAPKPLLLGDDVSVLGVPFEIMGYRPGMSIRDSLPGGWTAVDGRALWQKMLEAMAALHDLDAEQIGLRGFGRPAGFGRRQCERWRRRAATLWPDGPPRALDELGEALAASVPQPASACVLHMDLKTDNLLVSVGTGRLEAVIDWEMCTRGDPLVDLGVTLSYWVEPADPAPLHRLGQAPSLVPAIGTRTELAAHYAAVSGRSVDRIGWYLALARLRMSVIWRQLHLQWQQGRLAGPGYEDLDALSLEIANWALTSWRTDTI